MTEFTGVQVVESVDPLIVDALFKQGKLLLDDKIASYFPKTLHPNTFAVLKARSGASALARIDPEAKYLWAIRDTISAAGVKARNKEQAMLLATLLDDRVPVQIIAGKAGTGKTLLTLAAAIQKVDEGVYNKIILTKPMSQVGKYDLGILPGTIEDKFAPFLINYASNVEQLLGVPDLKKEERKKSGKGPTFEQQRTGLQGIMADFFRTYNVEMVPMQLLRGASFNKAFIIADEIQVLNHHEMLTLGTRVAEGSKLVLMGDLNQRDEKIAKNATGLHKTIHDKAMKESSLVSYIELLKVERGPVAELFARVFEPAS